MLVVLAAVLAVHQVRAGGACRVAKAAKCRRSEHGTTTICSKWQRRKQLGRAKCSCVFDACKLYARSIIFEGDAISFQGIVLTRALAKRDLKRCTGWCVCVCVRTSRTVLSVVNIFVSDDLDTGGR